MFHSDSVNAGISGGWRPRCCTRVLSTLPLPAFNYMLARDQSVKKEKTCNHSVGFISGTVL